MLRARDHGGGSSRSPGGPSGREDVGGQRARAALRVLRSPAEPEDPDGDRDSADGEQHGHGVFPAGVLGGRPAPGRCERVVARPGGGRPGAAGRHRSSSCTQTAAAHVTAITAIAAASLTEGDPIAVLARKASAGRGDTVTRMSRTPCVTIRIPLPLRERIAVKAEAEHRTFSNAAIHLMRVGLDNGHEQDGRDEVGVVDRTRSNVSPPSITRPSVGRVMQGRGGETRRTGGPAGERTPLSRYGADTLRRARPMSSGTSPRWARRSPIPAQRIAAKVRRPNRMYSLRRRLALLTLALSAAAVLTVGAGSSWAKHKPVHKTSTLSGTWSGQYSGGYNGTFTLNWTQSGSKLTGTIKLSSRAVRSPSPAACTAALSSLGLSVRARPIRARCRASRCRVSTRLHRRAAPGAPRRPLDGNARGSERGSLSSRRSLGRGASCSCESHAR